MPKYDPPIVASSLNHESRSQGIASLKRLHQRHQPRPPVSDATSAVYVTGFQWQKLRAIRQALFEARFQFRRIHKVSWIGRTIIGVILATDYKTQFSTEIAAIGYKIVTIDPTKNSKATDPETALHAKRCFVVRAVRTILSTYSSIVKSHFTSLIDNGDQDIKNIFQEEMAVALRARDESIAAIVNQLKSETRHDPELISELEKLDPSNEFLKTLASPTNSSAIPSEGGSRSE